MVIISVLNVIRISIILHRYITPATVQIWCYENIYTANEIYLNMKNVNVLKNEQHNVCILSIVLRI